MMTTAEIAIVERRITELQALVEDNAGRLDRVMAEQARQLDRLQGTLACDPEYAEYLRWQESARV